MIPSHTIACHRNRKIPVAASLGHAPDQKRRAREGAAAIGTSSASMPASSTSRMSGVVVCMSERRLAIARRRSLGGSSVAEGGTIRARRAMTSHLLA